ncbi:hypothetical protein [Massilia niabensis]|uniref:Uncharacterized protein n=1 Tax=Massilia niabensis TaxID=544910 RepID=A0ABW0L6C3_9BURK
MEQINTNKTNWFVRVLISLFCLLLTAMIGFRFLWIEPKGDVSSGIITLLCLILVLVLAESFDNFSVGKLISISREAKKKEKEVEKLEKQNDQLLSQLISVSNTQSQNQNHTNVYGDYHAAAPSVRKASEEEVREQTTEAKQTTEAITVPPHSAQARLRVNWGKAEEIALQKYMQLRSIHPSNLITGAKMVNQFQGIDPISNQQIIFDGYLKDQGHEIFLEVRPNDFFSPTFRERLYMMLSKINHYRLAKRADAHLDLLLMMLPGEEPPRNAFSIDRIFETFEPAIASGLLKIVSIDFSEEEAKSCRESTERR